MKKHILIVFSSLIFSNIFSSRFTYNQINDAMKIVKKIMERNSTSSCVKNQMDLVFKLFSTTTDLNAFEVMLQNISIIDELGEPLNVGSQILDFASCITPQAPAAVIDEVKPSDKAKVKESSKEPSKEKPAQKNSKNNDFSVA